MFGSYTLRISKYNINDFDYFSSYCTPNINGGDRQTDKKSSDFVRFYKLLLMPCSELQAQDPVHSDGHGLREWVLVQFGGSNPVKKTSQQVGNWPFQADSGFGISKAVLMEYWGFI
jgi:hypothetical protein